MKKREMNNGDKPYWIASIDEMGEEISTLQLASRYACLNEVQHEWGESWILVQMENDEDTMTLEFRSDRNHLSVVAISPWRKVAKETAIQAFDELS